MAEKTLTDVEVPSKYPPTPLDINLVSVPKLMTRLAVATLLSLVIGFGWLAWQVRVLRSEVRDALAIQAHRVMKETTDGAAERE